jgi:Zn finger protein HypA/HybF involved in hydrogenase expression
VEKEEMKQYKIIAEYKCCNCNFKYQHPPMPTQCPKCGSDYVKWVNYNKLFGGDKQPELRNLRGKNV